MTTKSKSKLGDELRTMEAGIPLVLNDVQTLNLGGTNYTIPQVTAKIAAFIQAQADTLSALNTYRAAVVAEQASDAAAVIFRGQVQGYAISRFGKTSPVLSKLSFTPLAPKKTTAAVKAVAVLKTKATRKARNTMGKKQRLQVKGAVDPSILATLTAEPSSVAGPAPVTPAATPHVVALSLGASPGGGGTNGPAGSGTGHSA